MKSADDILREIGLEKLPSSAFSNEHWNGDAMHTADTFDSVRQDGRHHGSTSPKIMLSDRFGSALEKFLESAQKIVNSGYEAIGIRPTQLEPRSCNTNMIRIVAVPSLIRRIPDVRSEYAWAFVCLSTGDVLKPVGWSAAHPIERGNIFDSQNGTGGCDWTGPI